MSESNEKGENDWSFLPHTALVGIFEYLENHDRLNAGLVCQNWNFAFENPFLWPKMDFYFGSDVVSDSRNALQFMRRHASAVIDLRLRMRGLHSISHSHGEVALNLHGVLAYLRSCSRLRSLDMELLNYCLSDRWELSRASLLQPFKKFVASQHRLSRIVVVNSRFGLADGMEILEVVARQNRSLQCLGLTYFFDEAVTVFENPSFQSFLKCLVCLRSLTLSYQCFSSDILMLLCKSNLRHLSHLTVVCDSKENLLHTVPDRQWKELKRRYSNIRISFEMVGAVHLEEFLRLLPSSCGVSDLVLDFRCRIEAQWMPRVYGPPILRYVNESFSDHLRCIKLDFGFAKISELETDILNLLRSCMLLREATLTGVLSTAVATKVCEIALEEESVLQDLNLVSYFNNFETLEEMRQLEDYKQNLTDQGIKFHFNLLT